MRRAVATDVVVFGALSDCISRMYAQPSRVRVPHAFDIRAMMPEALVQRDCPGERRGRELPACATICNRNHPKS
jgi:hypothetical protein